jgi:hypothetical protein
MIGIVAAHQLSDRRLVAVTSDDFKIRWFNREGDLLLEAGGKGEAAGQFRGIGLVGVNADTLFLWDHQLDRGTVYSPEGKLVRNFTLTWGAGPETPRFGFVPAAIYANGDFLVSGRTGAASGDASGYRRDVIPLARANAAGIVDSAFALVPGNESVVASTAGFVSLLSRPFGAQTAVTTAANATIVSVGDREDVFRFNPEGDLATIARIIRPRRAIPPEDLKRHGQRRGQQMQELPEEMANAVGAAFVRAGVPASLPFHDRVLVDANGYIWLREDVGSERANSVDQRWLVLDETGPWLGVVTTPKGFTIHQITDSEIVGVWRDVDGVEYVRVYAIKK